MNESTSPDMTPEEKERRLGAIEAAIKKHQTDIDISYRAVGQLLREVKDFKPHGEWIPWVQAKTELSVCKAQHLMKVAKWIDGNEAPVSSLTFTQAYILSRLSGHSLEKFLDEFYLVTDASGKRVRLQIKMLLERGTLTKRELEEAVRNFLRKGNGSPSSNQAPQQAEAPSPPQNSLAARFDQVRADVQELAGLVENSSGEYMAFAKELCELCQDIAQRLSPEDLEDS